jgi:hypothetical protein
MSKLNVTTDFLTLYMHAVGQSEVPKNWHMWSAISLLAASMQNRIYLVGLDGRVLYSNLYIMLVGMSGEGKGTSCEKTAVNQFVLPTVNYPYVYENLHVLSGRWTMQAIYDYAKNAFPANIERHMTVVENPAFWLVQEELAQGVGRDPGRVNSFIEGMTEFYDKVGSETGDATRGSGAVKFRNPCVNWLSASTETWYVGVIGKNELLSGFGARILQIFGRKDYDQRFPFNVLPTDAEYVKSYLRDRIAELSLSQGPIYYTKEAAELYTEWYTSRPKPDDDFEKPVWNRIPVLSLKVAMITCLSRNEKFTSPGGENYWLLHPTDIQEGIRLIADVWSHLPKVRKHAASTIQSRAVDVVARIIRRYTEKNGGIKHSILIKRAGDYDGLNAEAVRPIIRQLVDDEGRAKVVADEHGKPVYFWLDAL